MKGKIERIKKKARETCEKMTKRLLRRYKQLEVVKEKIETSVRERAKEKHKATKKKKEEEIADMEKAIERERREADEKIAEYNGKIEEKAIKKLEGEIEEIKSKIDDSQPKPFFEMNTFILDFIILLLILQDNMHFYLLNEFFGEPFLKMNFHTAYKCIYHQQAKVKLVGDTLHLIYIKVPGKWCEGMRKAFERINARAISTPEGWRIHLEI